MTTAKKASDVMDLRQASAYLGFARNTLREWASGGEIPAFKMGNRWRFRKNAVDGWMAAREAGQKQQQVRRGG